MVMARLKSLYNDELKQQIKEELGLANLMQVPKITKITLNMGVGGASQDKKLLEGAVADMTAIAGQKPVVTKARKSVLNWHPFYDKLDDYSNHSDNTTLATH